MILVGAIKIPCPSVFIVQYREELERVEAKKLELAHLESPVKELCVAVTVGAPKMALHKVLLWDLNMEMGRSLKIIKEMEAGEEGFAEHEGDCPLSWLSLGMAGKATCSQNPAPPLTSPAIIDSFPLFGRDVTNFLLQQGVDRANGVRAEDRPVGSGYC